MNRLQSQSRLPTARRGTTANSILKLSFRQSTSLNVSESDSDNESSPTGAPPVMMVPSLTVSSTAQFVDRTDAPMTLASTTSTAAGDGSEQSSPSLSSTLQQQQQQQSTGANHSENLSSLQDSMRFADASVLPPNNYATLDPIMPDVITDQSAVHAVTKSFNRQMLPEMYRAALSLHYSTTAATLKEEEQSHLFRWSDELKFLLREWNFIFMAPGSNEPSTKSSPESQSLPRLGSGTFSRQSSFSRRRRMSPGKRDSGATGIGNTPTDLTLIPVPPSSSQTARHSQTEKLRTVSFTASVRDTAMNRGDAALCHPNPSTFVAALSIKLRHCTKPSPTSLRVENVPLGSSPTAVGALMFRGIARTNATLSKLSLCFCNLTTSSLMILMAGLAHSFHAGSQSSLTDLDLSYNQLTAQSLHVFSMFLKQTRIMTLSLRGNPIGGVQQLSDLELHTNFGDASPSDPDSGDEAGSVRSAKTVSTTTKSPLTAVAASRSHSSSRRTGAVASSSLSRSALKQFILDCVPSFETLDLSFTAMSTEEIEVIIDKIHELPILRYLHLDGLAITQGTAAKLAVAVKFSPSLWNVSVRYNFSCSSESYLEKLNSACNARRERATSRRSRRALHNRSSQFGGHGSPPQSFSLKTLNGLPAGKGLTGVEMQWVDTDNALSEGYGMYTTNDPSVQARRAREYAQQQLHR